MTKKNNYDGGYEVYRNELADAYENGFLSPEEQKELEALYEDWTTYKDIPDEWKTFWHGYGQGVAFRAYKDDEGNIIKEDYADDYMKNLYKKNPEAFVASCENARRRQAKKEGQNKFNKLNGTRKSDEGETIQ